MSSIVSNNFHDATFHGFKILWEEGLVEITITNYLAKIFIICHSFENISLTRHFEWGESVSIYEAKFESNGPNSAKLWMQLQSGDVLECKCARMEFKEVKKSDLKSEQPF